MGERMLAQLLPAKTVASAGIASAKSGLVGKPADKTAIQVAAEHGVDVENHASQQLTSELCKDYDLILVMEKGHLEALTSIAPEARGKTMLFGQWIGQKDIPDPYRQSREAFDHAYELIEQSAKEWVKKL
ncbi:low molecular weight phosphotyrosine protein phosphatase [Vibrio cionasavignyae]|uniref:arsenate reductase/protein-tyrosine-phosphatase family protein n=1 Tax=Vibrio cionasavignyae TaxID=2910252 RepID=UPI003D09AE56